MTDQAATVLLITGNGMGTAQPALAHRLLDRYLRLLLQDGRLPRVICFYTEGVKLVVDDSPLLEPLQLLEERGVRLVVCSTCLDYYGMMSRVRVGVVGGMPDILEAQLLADKVITL